MTRLRNFILPGIGLGALVGGIVLGTTAPAIASAVREVLVVNTPAEPVPVAPQGITTVAGTVSAQQSGAWTVGISGTPGVTVTNPIKIDPAGNTVSAQQSGSWTVGISGTPGVTVTNPIKIDPAANTVSVGNLPTDSQGRLKTVRLGTLTQVSGPFTILDVSSGVIGPRLDTTSCHSVLALVSFDTTGALPPLNPLDLRLEMYAGGLLVGRVTGTIVNDTVFQGTAAEFVINGQPVVPPVSQLEYQNHTDAVIPVLGVWLYCAP